MANLFIVQHVHKWTGSQVGTKRGLWRTGIHGLDFGLDWNSVQDLLFNKNFECWINE